MALLSLNYLFLANALLLMLLGVWQLRSDGVAYRGPIGRPLSWHQLGLDVTESDQLLTILNH